MARTGLKNAIFNTEQQRWTTDRESLGMGPREQKIIPLPIVRTRLAADEAVLEYVAGDQQFYCLVITAKSARIVTLANRMVTEDKIDSYFAGLCQQQSR